MLAVATLSGIISVNGISNREGVAFTTEPKEAT
jgi:hypothetical protein